MNLRLLVIVGALLLSTESLAGIEPMEGCPNVEGNPVPTVENSEQMWVVRADDEHEKLSIVVNYEMASRQYLGRQTLRWLYLRECAHLVLNHRPLDGLSPASQEEADCWALKRLIGEGEPWVAKKLAVTIERDLKDLQPEQWKQFRLGERRDPDIGFRCRESLE
jgi:hypothetical protein